MSLDIRNCHTPWPGNKTYSIFTRTRKLFIHIRQRDSTRFWTLKQIKNRIFCYPASCGRGPTPLWRAVSKRCGFGQLIHDHWFYKGGKVDSSKKICGFSYI